MRIIRYLPLVLVALMLVGCTVPGGTYKGYDGPDKDLKDIAVLDWSAPQSGVVSHIDGKRVPGSVQLLGVATTRAYLLPGIHAITVLNNWEELELGDDRDFFLRSHLQAGRFYVVIEDPCKRCDHLKVTVTIEGTATGESVGTSVRIGGESYRAARSRLRLECMIDCRGDYFCESSCPQIYW